MSTFHFTQNSKEYDNHSRRIKRIVFPVTVTVLVVFAWLLSIDGIRGFLPFSLIITTLLCSGLVVVPYILFVFHLLNRQRGETIIITDHSITQKWPKKQQEVVFSDVSSLNLITNKNGMTITVHESELQFMSINFYTEINKIADLLKQRVPSSAEIINQSTPTDLFKTSLRGVLLDPSLSIVLIFGFLGFWFSLFSYDVSSILTGLTLIVLFLSGAISKKYASSGRRGKNVVRSAELGMALLSVGILVWSVSISDDPLFNRSHPCNPFNRAETGCQRFLHDVDNHFTYADDSNDIIIAERSRFSK